MKIRPVGDELYPWGRTDMMKPIVAFHNFADAPKIRPRQASVITK